MKNKKISKLFFFLILVLILIKFVFFICQHKTNFISPFNPDYFSKLYSQSQYVIGSSSEGIGDDGVYAFAGYFYLFQRGDVSQVNFEHPPLGKYLIGLSIFLFNNQNVINLFYFFAILFITYRIGILLLKNELLSLIAVFLLSINPVFTDNLLRSMLDLPFTLFFLLSIFYFLKALKKSFFLYVSSLFLAFAFTTKFFPAIIFIILPFILIIFFYRRRLLFPYFFSLLIIPLVYTGFHFSYFMNNHSLIEFMKHKKWMVAWWSGSPIIIGNIWRNILTGSYIDSIGILQQTKEWTLLIPIVTFLGLTSFRLKFLKKENLFPLTIFSTCFSYLIYLTFLNGGMIRFMMPIYPLLLVLGILNLKQTLKINH